MTSRQRLPDLKGIQVERISDADKELARFLSDCIPVRLQLLAVNYCASSYTGIKSKFYVGAFAKAASRTAKEVFFNCIDFSAVDLQTVVRAAHSAERIVFRFCCIHCSSGLNFGADLSYNTKFLSFQSWGNMTIKGMTTDWKTDPSKFSLIVDTIGNSGLKASLEKLSIYDNKTLSVSKVQEEFNTKGMPHITVFEGWWSPLSS